MSELYCSALSWGGSRITIIKDMSLISHRNVEILEIVPDLQVGHYDSKHWLLSG